MQRVCKCCGNKWALISSHWVQVQKLLKNKNKDTMANYNYICKECDPKDEAYAAKQTMSCRQCRENRTARPSYYSNVSMEVSLVTGGNRCTSPGTDETLNILKTTSDSCCEADCPVFLELIEARNTGIMKRGVLLDPCENCTRYWNKYHEEGPCTGKFVDQGECITYYIK